jgi:methyl-accepting chemotaxis protein
MQQLVGTAERMRSLLSEIAAGAAEQSAGIARIGASIQALDRQTQQNAARVDQTATAGGALHDHALALAQRVSKFKLP